VMTVSQGIRRPKRVRTPALNFFERAQFRARNCSANKTDGREELLSGSQAPLAGRRWFRKKPTATRTGDLLGSGLGGGG